MESNVYICQVDPGDKVRAKTMTPAETTAGMPVVQVLMEPTLRNVLLSPRDAVAFGEQLITLGRLAMSLGVPKP